MGSGVNYHEPKEFVASIGQFLPVINLFIEGHAWNGKILDVLCGIYVSIVMFSTVWTSPFPITQL